MKLSCHKRIVRKDSGMLLFIILGTIAVIFIVFTGMVDRVRHEAAITNRVAINERLYQVSSAIGRLAIRKIQKKFELRDGGFGNEIFDAKEQGKTGVVMSGSMTSELRGSVTGIDVVASMEGSFTDIWGNRGKLDFEVDYQVELLADSFKEPYVGFSGEGQNRETKGLVNLLVTAKHLGVQKEFRIQKEFFLVRLLPGPFYRFTLFSSDGANLQDRIANNTEVDETGRKVGGGFPLVCVNRQLDKSKSATYDFSGTSYVSKGANSFMNNGWIYLGGTGRSVTREDTRGLILNIATGVGDDNFASKFGEFFHFYYQGASKGWVTNEVYTNRLKSLGYDSKNDIKFLHVDFGVYKQMPDMITPQGNVLFRSAFKAYDSLYKNNNGHVSCFNSSGKVWSGSSLKLFGTVKACTPTVIFGSVMRRYVRTFALAFNWQGDEKFYILSGKGVDDFKRDVYTEETGSVTSEIKLWLAEKYGIGVYDNAAYDDFGKKFVNKLNTPGFIIYWDIVPQVPDYEPYNHGIRNICDPGGVDRTWSDVVGSVDSKYMPTLNKCKELLQNDYRFDNDENLHYSGLINDIRIESDYLKDRVTYRIPSEDGKTSLKNNKFFQDTFVTKDDDGKSQLFLNQIVEFEGDLVIDQDLTVQKGGIIVCDGNIEVSGHIANQFLSSASGADADNFGWLSLVSRKGSITLKSSCAKKIDAGDTLPQVHGFFIAKNNVIVDTRLHIMGGVVSKELDSLVKSGSVVQWGFHPEEIMGSKDLSCRDYYGLAFGPRVIEVIVNK